MCSYLADFYISRVIYDDDWSAVQLTDTGLPPLLKIPNMLLLDLKFLKWTNFSWKLWNSVRIWQNILVFLHVSIHICGHIFCCRERWCGPYKTCQCIQLLETLVVSFELFVFCAVYLYWFEPIIGSFGSYHEIPAVFDVLNEICTVRGLPIMLAWMSS